MSFDHLCSSPCNGFRFVRGERLAEFQYSNIFLYHNGTFCHCISRSDVSLLAFSTNFIELFKNGTRTDHSSLPIAKSTDIVFAVICFGGSVAMLLHDSSDVINSLGIIMRLSKGKVSIHILNSCSVN